MTEDQFLEFVERYVAGHPLVAPRMAAAAQRGLSAALAQANRRAADMEVIAACALARRFRGAERALVTDKLRALAGGTALRWDWWFEENGVEREGEDG